jgi:hypothetical protein
MTKEEYFDARYKKTIEAISTQQELLLSIKAKRQRGAVCGYIAQLKKSLSSMEDGTFWNPLREYYFNILHANEKLDYDAISVI